VRSRCAAGLRLVCFNNTRITCTRAPSCLGPVCCLCGFVAAAHAGPLHAPALCELRYPEESDAQSLRTAVLLDELDYPGAGLPDPRTAHVVVELKTANAIPLLRYCCGPRIMALPTAQLNARRCASPSSLSCTSASEHQSLIPCQVARPYRPAETEPDWWNRMARMVRSPVVGMISTLMWSFNSASQAYLQVLQFFLLPLSSQLHDA